MRYQDFKDVEVINEAEMNPKAFAAAIKEGGDLGVLIGFEFEICMPRDRVAAWEEQGAAALNVTAGEPVQFGTMTVKGFMQKFTRFITGSYIDDYFEPVVPIPGSRTDGKIYKSYAEASRVSEFKVAFDTALKDAIERTNGSGSRHFVPPTAEEWSTRLFDSLKEEGIDIDNDAKIAEFTSDNRFKDTIINAAKKFENNYWNERSRASSSGVNFNSPEYQVQYLNYNFWGTFRSELRDSLSSYQTLLSAMSRDTFAKWTKQTFGSTKMSDLVPGKWKIREGKERAIINIINGRHPEYDPSRVNRRSGYNRGADFVQGIIAPVFGKTNIFTGYHQSTKNLTDWYIEPDGSLSPSGDDYACEVVTPPMPAPLAIENLKKFYALARDNGFYTGKKNNTGLHINVSIPRELDVLKLAMFLGDEYVLKAFGREANRYATSLVKDLRGRSKDTEWKSYTNPLGKLKTMAASISNDHFSSINNTGKYVSFRHAGGDYLNQPEEVINVVGRFVRAMTIASDPGAYRNEYLAKAAKFIKEPEKKTTDPREVLKNIRENGVSVIRQQIYFWDDMPNPDGLQLVVQRQFGLGSDDVKVVDIVSGTDEIKQKLVNASGWSGGTKERLAAADLNRFVEIAVIPTSIRGIAALNQPQTLNKAFGAYLNGSRIGAGVISTQDKLTRDAPEYQQVVKKIIGQASSQLIKDREARATQQPAAATTSPAAQSTEQTTGWGIVDTGVDELSSNAFLAVYTETPMSASEAVNRLDDRSRVIFPTEPGRRDSLAIVNARTGETYNRTGNLVDISQELINRVRRATGLNTEPARPVPGSEAQEFEIVNPNDNSVIAVLGTMSHQAADEAAERYAQARGIQVRLRGDGTVYHRIYGTAAEQPVSARPDRMYEIYRAGVDEPALQRITGSLEDAAAVAMQYIRQGNDVTIWDDQGSTSYNPRDLSRLNESREYGDPEPIYYFAYGMLTNPAQMEGAEFVGAATLPNFAFEFRGYANVYPQRGAVLGVLWKVSREWLAHLDRVEGYPSLYDRKTVPVYSGGHRYEANLYTMTPATREQLEDRKPSRSYLMRLVKGYNNADLPLQQISRAMK